MFSIFVFAGQIQMRICDDSGIEIELYLLIFVCILESSMLTVMTCFNHPMQCGESDSRQDALWALLN
jgi:hypothetical protein